MKLNLDYNASDQQFTRTTKSKLRQEKNAEYCNCQNKLFDELTPESKHMKGAMEKGASFWISALPIKATGYALNKQ